jgi:hypothetical protein
MDDQPAFMVGGGVAQSATGSWAREGVRTFAVTARRYADGTVAGQWERVQQGIRRIHGEVLCMTIIGNEAWIGTRTTVASDPARVGTEGGFRMVDNGEGANAAPDQMTLQAVNRGPGFADFYCAATPPNQLLRTVGAGQVQIGDVSVVGPGAQCWGQITSGIANTWPWAHNGQTAFPPPKGAIALWLEEFGSQIGISNVHELQLLFCGP